MEENIELMEENIAQENPEKTADEIVQTEQNIPEEETGSETETEQNEQNENDIVKKIFVEDTEEDIIDNLEENSEKTEDTLEEVILKYFNKKGDISDENTLNISEENDFNGDEIKEKETTDYTLQLEKIYDNTKESLENIETQTKSISDYNENNTLQSSVEDISLTNVLLLTLIVIMMFNGLLEFTRRIF